MHLDFLNDLLFQYGLYAVFILVMLEGDITLLLAGVLAHSGFFGEYSFAQVLIWGTIGGCLSDNLAYFTGRGFCEGVREVRFYRAARPRLERLTNKFGPLSIFPSTSTVCVGRRVFSMALGGCHTCDFSPSRLLVASYGYLYSPAQVIFS